MCDTLMYFIEIRANERCETAIIQATLDGTRLYIRAAKIHFSNISLPIFTKEQEDRF